MAEKKLSYSEAMAQIEEIVRAMNENEMDVDALGKEVERAVALIAMCKDKLQKAQKQVDEVLSKNGELL